MQVRFSINGRQVAVEIDPGTPLLWVIREQLGLTGTKFGCGTAMCDACAVQLDGEPLLSCMRPVEAAAGKRVTTHDRGVVGRWRRGVAPRVTSLRRA